MKKILTFKPYHGNRVGGRWWKSIGGKVRYFGGGKSCNDVESYREAEKEYFEFALNEEKNQTVEIPMTKMTIADVAEEYLQDLYSRHVRGEITAIYVEKSRLYLSQVLDRMGEKKINSITESDFNKYKNQILNKVFDNGDKRTISIYTAKDILKTLKIFIRWSWKMRLLDHLPRNIDDLAKIHSKLIEEPKPKFFTLDELSTLWLNANSRTQCFIVLGLNCGYGQTDVSSLRIGEVDYENGYIERDRTKTGIRAKHKLWRVTLRLLKEHCYQYEKKTDGSERVFLTSNNEVLVRDCFKADNKFFRSDAIKNAFGRLQKKTEINGGRGFYALRKTGSSIIEEIDPLATEMYLAHAEPGMKRHYAQRPWGRLEDALVEMEKRLRDVIGLKP